MKQLQEAQDTASETDLKSIYENLALQTDGIIEHHKVRDWKRKDDVKNAMFNDLEELLFDLKKNQLANMAGEVIDAILETVMRTAVEREQ
ncbi:MAG: hypothetical protein Fues2KO_46870 [Fuerstiella sp.]